MEDLEYRLTDFKENISEKNILTAYFKELRNYPLLDKAEEISLAKKMETGYQQLIRIICQATKEEKNKKQFVGLDL